ncbi:MAG: T9SS type A sorting domain-containing protein [Bacteroidetes bacterium]|nr:T9SS type A sorting domain-containing protein [Bacteroidota bacterium]
MRYILFPGMLIASFVALAILGPGGSSKSPVAPKTEGENPALPYEWMELQRSWPDAAPDAAAYQAAMRQAYTQEANARMSSTVSWTVEGPGNIGGRFNSLAVDPNNNQVMFAGSTTGGLWKTSNGGQTWLPVFDNNPSLSIGCIVFEPGSSSTIYVGTGDPNVGGYPFIGTGIYKTTDGGQTWTNLGLGNTYIISDIAIDPSNTNIIYAAAMGLPFVRDNNRGLYKSTDGGQTWTQSLFVSNQTGVTDLVLDPSNPQILYAASWSRIRNNQESFIYSTESKIWKTTNGGASWNAAMAGIPNQAFSRIGLAMYPGNTSQLFAMLVDTTLQLQGIYTTTNAASSWSALPTASLDPNALGGFGWYFGKIYVKPNDPNTIYMLGVDQWRTTDGGQTWNTFTPPWYTYEVHADGHDLDFNSAGDLILCTDGGIYQSSDDGVNWTDIENIPANMFYRVASNPFSPNDYYGGMQDNGTSGGNSTNINSWPRIYGGDGFQAWFHPSIGGLWYVETQNGSVDFTDDGGFSYYPLTFGDFTDRKHWDMPYLLSVHDPSVVYLATHRVHKLTGAPYGAAVPISNDLTDGIIYGPRFHTITALNESPLAAGHLYAGTLDGNVWVTTNDGGTWTDVTGNLPNRYVTAMKGSPNMLNTIYVTHSGYKSNDFIPHIHKSTNNGQTWTDISGDLPQFGINDLVIMQGNENVLFVATDAGVYFTTNGGVNWTRVGNNMPVIPVYSLGLNNTGTKLVAGTFARSIQTISITALLTGTEAETSLPQLLRIWPNPAQETLQLELPTAADAVIVDMNGKQVRSLRCTAGINHIDIAALPAGVYFVRTNTGNITRTSRFVKQ